MTFYFPSYPLTDLGTAQLKLANIVTIVFFCISKQSYLRILNYSTYIWCYYLPSFINSYRVCLCEGLVCMQNICSGATKWWYYHIITINYLVSSISNIKDSSELLKLFTLKWWTSNWKLHICQRSSGISVVTFVPPTSFPLTFVPLDKCPPGQVSLRYTSPWTSVPPGLVSPRTAVPLDNYP